MGLTIEIDDLDDLCAMMCDNKLPRRRKHERKTGNKKNGPSRPGEADRRPSVRQLDEPR
jgi:hypothetical protein